MVAFRALRASARETVAIQLTHRCPAPSARDPSAASARQVGDARGRRSRARSFHDFVRGSFQGPVSRNIRARGLHVGVAYGCGASVAVTVKDPGAAGVGILAVAVFVAAAVAEPSVTEVMPARSDSCGGVAPLKAVIVT